MKIQRVILIVYVLMVILLVGCGQVKIPDVPVAEMQSRILEGKTYIAENGLVQGDPVKGASLYHEHCQDCHGEDGKDENFGDEVEPVWLGTSAKRDALAFFRVINFGDAAREMPGFYDDVSLTQLVDVVAYSQTLVE